MTKPSSPGNMGGRYALKLDKFPLASQDSLTIVVFGK